MKPMRRDATGRVVVQVLTRVIFAALITSAASGRIHGLQMLQRSWEFLSLLPDQAAAVVQTSTPTVTVTTQPTPTPMVTTTPTVTVTTQPTTTPTVTVTTQPTNTATVTVTTQATNTATVTVTMAATGTPTATTTSAATNTATPTGTGGTGNTATPTGTLNTPGPTTTITPTLETGAGVCSDGIDNDLDGLIDCEDPSCQTTPPCLQTAPALSPTFLALLNACLLVAALSGIRRRNR